MKLRELNCFNEIIIQAHDNPDADSIASGFGLYWFFRKTGKQVRFIYGGENSVRKSNLVMMLDTLSIPMEHVTELEHSPELLITVDCQYGERNVQKFPAQHIAVIDHHPSVTSVPSGYSEIRDRYGSCSTLVWDLLTEEGYDPGRDEYLATALYYGLYMDTGRLQELGHPKDRDMRDSLEFRCRRGDLLQLINKNITFDEFCLAGRAMEDAVHDAGNGCLLVEAGACDPNLLGVISDAGIEVDTVDNCVVYSILDNGVKLSVRSYGNNDHANEIISYLTENIGSGGGHIRKAGGFIVKDLFLQHVSAMSEKQEEEDYASHVRSYLLKRLDRYFREQVVIHSEKDDVPNLTGCPVYEKKRIPMGYVKATDLYPAGTLVKIRMLEGDKDICVTEDIYFIIGVESEVYYNDADYFFSHNDPTDEPYQFHGEYAPTVQRALRSVRGEETPKSIKDYAKTCIPKEKSRIYASQLTIRTKVFSPRSEGYCLGLPGDYLVARVENPTSCYIIKADILGKIYQKLPETTGP